MAAATIDDRQTNPLDEAFDLITEQVLMLPAPAAMSRIKRYRARLDATEAVILAPLIGDDGDTKAAEQVAGRGGKTSKREQKRKAKRAKAVKANKGLADKMANGEMSGEQVDVVADAAEKTGGDAAIDDDFIDHIAGVNPDQGRGIGREYVAKKATAGDTQTEHDIQRSKRQAIKYRNEKHGLSAITIEGDDISIKNMWTALQGRANELYDNDGGRDVPISAHPRTAEQRRYDAANQLIRGLDPTDQPATSNGKGKPAGVGIVIGLTVDKMCGRDPASVATQIGFGAIPDSVLAEYAEYADLFAVLYDRNGEPMWLARLERYGTDTQRVALILRDKGCVICRADHAHCEIHHRIPWNAPLKGRSDLPDLVLLCPSCHRKLHRQNRTLYRGSDGRWHTRPATPDETPPARPRTGNHTPQRE